MGTGRGVAAILVTYHPEPRLLDEVLRAAGGQVDHLIIIDNGSSPSAVQDIRRIAGTLRTTRTIRVTEVYSPENRGLPIPFNEGIRIARDAGDRFVLFLDHDSVLLPGAVPRLLEENDRLAGAIPLGALEAHNDEPIVLPTDDFLAGYWRRHAPTVADGVTDDFLGTNSGLFVPLTTIDRIGGFDEGYFVDAVDFEFSLRLRSAGLRLLQISDARIRHQRGEPSPAGSRPPRFEFRRVRPARHYYVARDTFRTWRRYWRKFPLVGLFLFSMPVRELMLVILFYTDRRAHLYYLGLGTLHAMLGVRGPLPASGTRGAPPP